MPQFEGQFNILSGFGGKMKPKWIVLLPGDPNLSTKFAESGLCLFLQVLWQCRWRL